MLKFYQLTTHNNFILNVNEVEGIARHWKQILPKADRQIEKYIYIFKSVHSSFPVTIANATLNRVQLKTVKILVE